MVAGFPEWIRREWASGDDFEATRNALQGLGVHTVCQSARCPNMAECWKRHTATLMVLGGVCTRSCAFCAVKHGMPSPVDDTEPWRVAAAIRRLQLGHAVITMVTRDDLPDGGAAHVAKTVSAIRSVSPGTTVETLVSDLQGAPEAIDCVLSVRPDVFGHNIETVDRLHGKLRDRRYRYTRSLDVLRQAARNSDAVIKSAFMVGHGETEAEVRTTLEDLREAGCVAVSIGQYLRPTPREHEVVEYVTPDRFQAYEDLAHALGFAFALAGPFVRSSYHSGDMWSVLGPRRGALSSQQSGFPQESGLGRKEKCSTK